MFGPISGSLKVQAARILVICAATAALACASTPSPGGSEDFGSESPADVQQLSGVDVTRDGQETLITLSGLDSPAHSEFVLEDENVVVVDLPGVAMPEPTSLAAAFGDGDEQISVYDGLVDQVTASSFEGGDGQPVTRVEIALATVAEWEVESGLDGVVVRVRSAQAMMDDEELNEDELALESADPWSNPDAVIEDEPVAVAVAVEVVPPSPASVLQSVVIEKMGAGLLVHLGADGIINSVETFILDNPDRLVVDLPGMTSEVEQNQVDVGSDQVARVRVGAHQDKVRVVVDGGPGSAGFQGKRVVPAATGLFLTVGAGEDLDQSLAAAVDAANATTEQVVVMAPEISDETPLAVEETMVDEEILDEQLHASSAPMFEEEAVIAEAAVVADVDMAAAASAEIYGIQYDSTAERDRIAVLSDQVIDYTVLTPDPETVVVSIQNAMIAPSAGERITPKVGGPISLITSFQQPDVPGQEVRVVMKRAPGLEPTVTRRGSLLFIDFANTGVAAAPPPAFIEGESTEVAVSEDLPVEIAEDAALVAAATEVGESDESAMLAAATLSGDESTEEAIEDLPAFDEPAVPASIDDDASLEAAWNEPEPEAGAAGAVSFGSAAPASLEPPAAVEMLEEGGLIDGKEYKGRRISLDFKDVEVADVLRLIAEVSDLNIIAGDEVQGVITIRLVDVPWDQALDVILLTKGLGFVRVGNVLRIAPADILKVEEEVRLQERRNKEKLEDLEVKLQPVNYAKVEDVSKLVKRLLSARGTVNVDQRTNTVIIKDISSVIDEATALIQAVDTQTPQVMIEAKIVEASLDFARELGSTWAVGTQPLVDGFDSGSDPRSDLGNDNFRFQGANNVAFSNPITSTATGALNFGAFLLNDKMRVDVQIQAAEATGEGKVISSPRIVTLDNREAIIEQGVSIPFQTFEGGDAKLEFIDAVLSLKVTPHITTDRSIIMSLEVTRNAPDASVPTPTGSPAIAKNQAQTETLVKDGQTLVIGGIYTIDKTERETRVPYLHRIPVIGAAFKSRELSDKRKELLIFVTPRVVLNPALASG